MTKAAGIRTRKSFAKIPDILETPSLIAIQRKSFQWFLDEGLSKAFKDISPVEAFTGNLAIEFGESEFGEIKNTVAECKEKDMTYSAPLFVWVRFINKETGEIKEQQVFMGDFPLMTVKGTFVINGTERVVVSQLVRSPGVYFNREIEKTTDHLLYSCKIIPGRGAWVELETDKKDIVYVRIDRKRKQPVTILLKALGFGNNEELLKTFGNAESIRNTLEKDTTESKEEALVEIYKRLRPGEPPTIESARLLLDGMFFNENRYDLAKVGRYKVNKQLGLDIDENTTTLTKDDIIETVKYLVNLHAGTSGEVDDIDHFGNRRIRSVGELIQNQFKIGLARMERVVRERMTTLDIETITPQTLVNIRPIVAAIKEFFGSSQLSQFMDQTNPLAGLTHKRRLSALGPGGLSRERAGFEVRDVHPSHYGRMCPIETPEGPNIGLIGSLATFARINEFGFIETPYRKVKKGVVTKDIHYLTADEEDKFVVAQANAIIDDKGKFKQDKVLVRIRDEVDTVEPAMVDYMDVAPRQTVSVATALIPFLEHDDANRALMGSNMQRQAVPLLRTEAPVVGTGMEHRAVKDTGEVVVAEKKGKVVDVCGDYIDIDEGKKQVRRYDMAKFQRSNQGTCVNQKPIVNLGQKVDAGEVIGDGPSTDRGELALGRNLLVAFMPWEGYNYEDAIIISERLVKEDLLTSIHIEEHEVEARDTKLGPEELTREIPNVGEEALKDLDENGVIRVGAEVFPGDILVGKVTPKGETELTAEERLLRAIFGEKAREVRDTSLKVPHGETGRVIDVKEFSRLSGNELSPGVNELVRVYVAQKRKISEGDKLAGRHGNKGVISKIVPEEDMPFLADGTPVDIVLNPLGVPSRMNLGQILETHLGWAAMNTFKDNGNGPEPVFVASPVFDGATEQDIEDTLIAAGLPVSGKTILNDGRSGRPYPEPITVGYIYILKLLHLVDDKIHARSTGPYSLVTQQPLGGKAQFGGQRFGEMEVWALEAYGCAYTLQELLTVKSDDVLGRVKAYEAIVKGENIPEPGIPESFKVLIKEMQSLGLDVEVLTDEGREIELVEGDEDIFKTAAELGIDLRGELAPSPSPKVSTDEAEQTDKTEETKGEAEPLEAAVPTTEESEKAAPAAEEKGAEEEIEKE